MGVYKMATIKEVKKKIENANALGRQNLTEKGVTISETATTYDIMTAIAEIVSGGGANYESIVYNDDDTITLTDKDGVEHTMSCTYEDGKLIGVTYDGKAVNLTYDGDVLVKVGKTAVDMANAQTSEIELLDHTVKFMVDGEPYEVVSVKDGNSVNEPTTPEKEDLMFAGWLDSENALTSFPLTPTDNIELLAKFDYTLETQLYNFYGVSKADYPYVLIEMTSSYMYLHFLSSYTESTNSISHPQPYLNGVFSNPDSSMVSSTSVSEVVHYVMENIKNLGTVYRPIPGTIGSNMFTNANLETYSKSTIYKI
jgi:hypothetical protein